MEKIPTAESYIAKNITDYWEGGKAQYTEEDVKKAMIEFAKLHVEAALKEASVKAKTIKSVSFGWTVINKDSILNSYSLDNIK